MKKLSSYLLNEDSHNKRILKEEISPETKKAIVYHLTGSPWNEQRNYPELSKLKSRNVDLEYARASDYLFHTPLEELLSSDKVSELNSIRSKSIGEKGYSDFLGTPQGKAHFIASNLYKEIYAGGSSFKAGSGAAYGKGLYSCYELNPEIASRYGDVILKFEVDISNFLIFVEDIAKDIHGENYRLEDQFLSILERKNFDIDLVEDVNTPVGAVVSSFLNSLSDFSDGDSNENSRSMLASKYGVKGSTTGTRTAPVASKCLYEFSNLTQNNVLLRSLIDGIIFFGSGDGPVCLIYRPETSYKYYPIGAGFFKNDGNPVIVDDIERLRGFKGIKLSEKSRIARMQAQRKGTPAYNKKLLHDSIEKDSIDALTNIEADADGAYRKYIASIFKEYNDIVAPEQLCKKVIEGRFNSAGSAVNKWGKFVHNLLNYASNCIPMLIDPTVKLINLIGPGIQAINAEDFIKYHSVFIQVSEYISKTGINKQAFSAIRNSYKELVFDEKFLKIINHNTDNDKIIDDLRYLVGPNSFESYFPYHSVGYEDLLNFNNVCSNIFVMGWGDVSALESYIENSSGVSEGIDFPIGTDKAIINEYFASDEYKSASKSYLDLIDSNIEYKTKLYKALVLEGVLDPVVDPTKDSVTFDPDLSGMSSWSDAVCTISHITYVMLDMGRNSQIYKSAVEKYKSTSYEVSYSKIMRVMHDEGLHAVEGNSLSQFDVSGPDCYISNVIIDYPHDYLPTSWNDIKRLMKDFGVASVEEIIKNAIQEKSDNLSVCMEMEMEENGFYGYLQSQLEFRAKI